MSPLIWTQQKVEQDPLEVSTTKQSASNSAASVSLRKRSALKKDSNITVPRSLAIHVNNNNMHGETAPQPPDKTLFNNDYYYRSSDSESETLLKKKYSHSKSVSEEKLLLLKNDCVKIVSNESYATFDFKCSERKGKLMKFKSLDVPEFKNTTVKYVDRKSKVSISAEHFDMSGDGGLPGAVDVWSRKYSKGMFNNLRNSFFHRGDRTPDKVVYKTLVFGGTYPIDAPIGPRVRNNSEGSGKGKISRKSIGCPIPKLREYGPARTFDIDQPI